MCQHKVSINIDIIRNDFRGILVLVVLNIKPLYDHVMNKVLILWLFFCFVTFQPKPSMPEQEVSLSASPTIKQVDLMKMIIIIILNINLLRFQICLQYRIVINLVGNRARDGGAITKRFGLKPPYPLILLKFNIACAYRSQQLNREWYWLS